MIKLNAEENTEGCMKILDYTDVDFIDGKEDCRPVKKVTIELTANDIPIVIVERYVMRVEEGADICTVDEEGKGELLTHKERYVIAKKDDEDIILNLVRMDKD